MIRTWLRIVDCATDWGFYGISLTTLRFKFLAVKKGYDHALILNATLSSCIVATLLLIPDAYLVPKQWRIAKRRLDESESSMYAKAQDTTKIKRIKFVKWSTWVQTLGVVVLEDLPQLCLTALYINIVGG